MGQIGTLVHASEDVLPLLLGTSGYFDHIVTSEAAPPEQESDSAFGKGYWLFFGFAGGIFAALAIAMPIVMLTSSSEPSQAPQAPPPTLASDLPGEALAGEIGCVACHTTDGTESVGPTWAGLAGSDRLLDSGETVVADDNYLHSSIVDPPSQIVSGFNPIMPTGYADQLTDQEIQDLIDYIKSLS
jgi:cytochrome c551/c552